MPKGFETVTRELTELLSGAAEVLSGDMMHLAVRRADRVSVLRYTPFGGCRETTAEDYIQDMDALEKVYASGSMTLRKDGTARAFGKSDIYGQVRVCAPWGGDLAAPFPAHICCPSPVVQVLGGTMDERPYLALLGQDGRVYLEGAPGPALQEIGRWQGIRALTALSGVAEGWPEWEWEQKSVILGLGFDGRVRALCRDTGHMTGLYRHVFRQLEHWTDIVQPCGGGDPFPRSGSFAVAGLRKDGTVLFSGGHSEAAKLWKGEDIPVGAIIPEEQLQLETARWQDIRRLWYTMGHLVGQRADGTLLLSREKSY